jgi:hypothetical protein
MALLCQAVWSARPATYRMISRHQDSSEPRYQNHAKMQTDLQYLESQSCLGKPLKW